MQPKVFKLTITDFHDHYGTEKSLVRFFLSLSDVGVKAKIEDDYDVYFEGNTAVKYYKYEEGGRRFYLEEIDNIEVV